jgi:hypothetical protein
MKRCPISAIDSQLEYPISSSRRMGSSSYWLERSFMRLTFLVLAISL